VGELKLEALLSACAVPHSPFFSEESPASLRTAAASDALRTPVDIFAQVTLGDLTDLRSPASGNGVALSRCDASVQLPFMLDFGSPAALFSTSPAHALPSPMVFPPCDAVKFSAKVTVAASLSPGVNTFKEPSTPMMLSPCGQLLGTPCGGWDQAEKLEWGAQWAAEDKLVTFAPGTVGASIQRAAEKIGSPALDHLDQACEFCEGNEAGPQCKGSEISDSEGEGEADPGSVAPPEKASDDHMISVPVRPGGQSEEMQRVGMRPKCKFCLRSFISQHAVDVHLTRHHHHLLQVLLQGALEDEDCRHEDRARTEVVH